MRRYDDARSGRPRLHVGLDCRSRHRSRRRCRALHRPDREGLRRPKLSLDLKSGTSDSRIVRGLTHTGEEFSSAYLHLRACNKRGRVAAEDVEAIVTGARETKLEDPQLLRIEGLPLEFSNAVPTATRMHISPGAMRRVNLAHIDLDRPSDAERPVWIDARGDHRRARPPTWAVRSPATLAHRALARPAGGGSARGRRPRGGRTLPRPIPKDLGPTDRPGFGQHDCCSCRPAQA